jgi:hypothetical protein
LSPNFSPSSKVPTGGIIPKAFSLDNLSIIFLPFLNRFAYGLPSIGNRISISVPSENLAKT